MDRQKIWEAVQADQAEQREAARQRRIREGGPEVTPDDLTVGEVLAYDKGGFLPSGTIRISIDPDECIISAEDAAAGRWRCSRAGHPTATSDCTTGRQVFRG